MKVYKLLNGNSVIVTDISPEDNTIIEHIFSTYHGKPPRPGAYNDRIYLIENNCNSFIRHKYLRSSMDSFEIDYVFLDEKDCPDLIQIQYEVSAGERNARRLIIRVLRKFFICQKFRKEVLDNKEVSKEKDKELYSHYKNCDHCRNWLLKQRDTMLCQFFTCYEFRKEVLDNKEISKEKDEELYSHLKNCEYCRNWLLEQSDIKIDFNLNQKED